jgi:flagellar basal body rod protein FlgG
MVDMIVSLRAYESSQRVIHSIDETLQRGINTAGSVGGS